MCVPFFFLPVCMCVCFLYLAMFFTLFFFSSHISSTLWGLCSVFIPLLLKEPVTILQFGFSSGGHNIKHGWSILRSFITALAYTVPLYQSQVLNFIPSIHSNKILFFLSSFFQSELDSILLPQDYHLER